MDLERDLFRITLSEGDPSAETALLDAVRELNYTPSIEPITAFGSGSEPVHAVGKPPDLIRRALERAKAEKKRFVLVDCMGDT